MPSLDINAAPRIEFLGRTGKVPAFRLPDYGLEFALKPIEASSHDHALSIAAECRLLGHEDWKVPSRKELELLVCIARRAPATWPELAKHTPTSDWYWTRDLYSSDPGYAWGVHFYGGGVPCGHRSDRGFVRAVRAVPPSQ